MKPTFTTQRNAAPNAQNVQMAAMMKGLKSLNHSYSSPLKALPGTTFGSASAKKRGGAFGPQKSETKVEKSKKETAIDEKIERLLLSYKRQDEEAAMRAKNIDAERKKGKK